MRTLFETSGEHPSLPISEIKACLSAYNVNFRELESKGVFIADVEATEDMLKKIAGRLAFSYSVNEIVAEGSVGEVEQRICEADFGKGKTFGIGGKKFREDLSLSYLKKRLGAAIKEKKNLDVELKNPEIKLNIFAGGKIYLCREIARVDRKKFERRKPQHRPFSSPISIHPKIARALVNLSRITEEKILLDPFCGTGGILIEAGMVGARVIGVDIKEKIVEGCRKNLEYYGIKNYVMCNEDSTTLDIEGVDAVVSDLPYGRSTYIGGDMEELYDAAFARISSWLGQDSFAVLGLPDKNFVEMGEKYLRLEEVHVMRVHKSLTRYFCVYRKA